MRCARFHAMGLGGVYLVGFLVLVAGANGCGDGDRGPDPRIQALWEDPAVCGAPAYAWRDDPDLGKVVDTQEVKTLDFSAAALDALLRSVGIGIPKELVYDVRVFQIRYVTQDRGERVEATATLAVPEPGEGDPTEFPLLGYLHGTVGFSDGCAPSAGLVDTAAAAALASFGHVVVGPDYLGLMGLGEPSTMGHPYLVAEPTALASLDALRAARRALRGDHPRIPAVTLGPGALLLGGSQGGHAALATAWYGPYYAPEEPIVAVAASVPPADLLGQTALGALQRIDATQNLAAFIGAFAGWYGADLSEVLRPPLDTTVPEHLATECGLGGILGDATSVESIFTEDFLQQARWGFPADGGPWSCMLRESSFLTTSVEPLSFPPTLWVLSENDELVNTPLERASFDALCARGFQMQYLECAGVEHTEGALGSFAEQIDFLQARLRGDPWDPQDICRRTAPVPCSGEVNLP